MRYLWTVLVAASLMGAMSAFVGCERSISEEKTVKESPNGQTSVQEKKVTEDANGNRTTVEEKKTNP